jgi:signal transduction histidine kinase
VVADVQPTYPEIAIEQEYQDDVWVELDQTLARMALANIVENAARYSTVAPRVEVSLRRTTEGMVEIAIADSCGGIEARKLDRMFDRYYRGTSDGPGLGLGLFIAERALDALGWKVGVKSAGSGCTFVITQRTKSERDAQDTTLTLDEWDLNA